MTTKRPNHYIRASIKDSQWREIRQAFDDFVDIDVMDITGGGEDYNLLAEAADRLLAEIKEILAI